jgi:diguanylate cyclase (GGDEF)-like protein
VLDIDHFKLVNDVWGHERGDAVLRDVSDAIRRAVRSFELIYRIGGEEFLVLMPGVGLEEAVNVAERIRLNVVASSDDALAITISAGVAAAAGEHVIYEDLFGAADGALLQAKREGRNRVVVAGRGAGAPGGPLADAEPMPEPSVTS